MNVYTTGKAAKFCRVSSRTVKKWLDAHYFTGYRLPGSLDRRIHGDSLRAFMAERGIPTDLIDAHESEASCRK